MIGNCPEDGWTEDAGSRAFVVYGVHAIHGHAAQVGFAVDLAAHMVVAARLLVSVPDGIRSESVETLPACHPTTAHAPRRIGPPVVPAHAH